VSASPEEKRGWEGRAACGEWCEERTACRDEGALPEVAATGTVGKQRSGGKQMRRERERMEKMWRVGIKVLNSRL
jgi:hypothetical protein